MPYFPFISVTKRGPRPPMPPQHHHVDSCPYIFFISLHWSLSPSFPNFQTPLTVFSGTHSDIINKTYFPNTLLHALFTLLAPNETPLYSRSSALTPVLPNDSCFPLPCHRWLGPSGEADLLVPHCHCWIIPLRLLPKLSSFESHASRRYQLLPSPCYNHL